MWLKKKDPKHIWLHTPVEGYQAILTLLFPSEQVSIALDETVEKEDLDDLFWVFNCKNVTADKVNINLYENLINWDLETRSHDCSSLPVSDI